MKTALALIALLGCSITACGGERRDTTATTSETTLAPATAPAPATPAPSTAAVEQQAAGNQESVGASAEERSDAALERLAAMPEAAQLPGGKWKAGVNYQPVVPAQPTAAAAGEVEVVEVFWYGCGHCYALEPFIQSWKKNKPAYVKFTAVPVMWGLPHKLHAKLYYTLEALGKEEQLRQKVFDEIHQKGNYLVANDEAQTFRMQLAFAKANGINEADFTREYNGFAVASKLARAEELSKRYRVEGVPVMFVNGKYKTDVGMAGGNSQLLQLVNDLAAGEKRR